MSWRAELTRRFPRLDRIEGAYVVGGAVRDLLAQREPVDVDVACRDPLAAARRIRDRVIRLGDAEHLSAYRVVDGDHVYDFAELLDGDIGADLARRDFTVNAMAVDLDRDELLDPHHGQEDLQRGLVRMVDAANFDEDPLRTLKGVRMAVKYRMDIEPATLAAIRERAALITTVAAERVTYELAIIFTAGSFRRALGLLDRTGLAGPLGLISRHVREDHVSEAAAYAIVVEDPRTHARRWRWSVELLRDVLALQQLLDRHDRLALFDAGERVARQLPAMLRALGQEDELDLPDFSSRPLLDGAEIERLTGVAPGPDLGRIKRALLEAQLRGEVSSVEQAETFVRLRSAAAEPLV